jgi:hypothetical protein
LSWIWIVYVWIALGAISGCAPYLELTEPMIVVDPIGGRAGTVVVVSGSGFPPLARVSVRLGPPSVGATPLSYCDVDTDASGHFALSFTMPSHWPDGTPITETNLVVVVLNQDGSSKANAAFGYLPSLTGDLAVLGVQEADRELILAWHREGGIEGFCGDVVVYANGYTEIVSCKGTGSLERRQLSKQAVDQLQVWAAAYQAFEIEQIQGTGPSRVQTRTTFEGKGARQVSGVELRMIQALLETLIPSS